MWDLEGTFVLKEGVRGGGNVSYYFHYEHVIFPKGY